MLPERGQNAAQNGLNAPRIARTTGAHSETIPLGIRGAFGAHSGAFLPHSTGTRPESAQKAPKIILGDLRCIWRRIPDAQPLLDLIPTGDPDAKKPTLSTDVRGDKSQLSRFEFYAPFVKELHLRPSLRGEEPNWHFLVNAVSRRPLLPNLSRLILDVPNKNRYGLYSFGSPEDLACVNAFICPSLVDIRLPSGYPIWIYPGIASQFLENIVDTAPELKVLHFYVHSEKGDVDATFHTLIRLQNLRALKCTSVMVDYGKLRLLGTLPQLESLQVVSLGDEDPLGDWALTAHSFPMLRHLSVYELPTSMVAQLWRLTSLVYPLVSISIKFQSEAESGEIICSICKNSPQTQELSLDLSDFDDPVIPTAATDHIRKLPLRRLRISGSDMIDEVTPLIFSMTNLEYLDIDLTDLSFEELIPIANYMPNLRFLCSNYLNFNRWLEMVEPDSVIPSPSTLCLVSAFAFGELFNGRNKTRKDNTGTMGEYLDTIARSLCTLWPRGVRCEIARHSNIFMQMDKTDEDYIPLLNQKIMALSQSEGVELPSFESFRSGWMYEF